jgi:hypothetical protein
LGRDLSERLHALSLFSHTLKLGRLLLGHELAASLVSLGERLFSIVLVASCERFFTAPLRALSPTGLFVAMMFS